MAAMSEDPTDTPDLQARYDIQTRELQRERQAWREAMAEVATLRLALDRGWERETAELWAWDYSDKALSAHGDRTAAQMAEIDVVEIERDDSNA
jgi:hypothetical protein